MLVFLKFLELRQMSRHFPIRKTFTIPTVISHAESNEVVSHNATDIAIVVQVAQRLILEKFMSRVSHGLSGIRCLSPIKWEADNLPRSKPWYVCQPDTLIIPQFWTKRQGKNERFGPFQEGGVYIPEWIQGFWHRNTVIKTSSAPYRYVLNPASTRVLR